jgi:hypothetical protein
MKIASILALAEHEIARLGLHFPRVDEVAAAASECHASKRVTCNGDAGDITPPKAFSRRGWIDALAKTHAWRPRS